MVQSLFGAKKGGSVNILSVVFTAKVIMITVPHCTLSYCNCLKNKYALKDFRDCYFNNFSSSNYTYLK